MALAPVVACVERIDYRIRITGIAPSIIAEALVKCGLGPHLEGLVKIKNITIGTLILFFRECDPIFVEDTWTQLLMILCPRINDGLIQAFEPQVEELRAIA